MGFHLPHKQSSVNSVEIHWCYWHRTVQTVLHSIYYILNTDNLHLHCVHVNCIAIVYLHNWRSSHKQHVSINDLIIDEIAFSLSKTPGADSKLNWKNCNNAFKCSNCSLIVIKFPCIILEHFVCSFAVGSRPNKTIHHEFLGFAFCFDS